MEKKYAFGVDVGGTTCKIGLFDIKGTSLYETEIPTDKADAGKNVLPDIAKKLNEILAERNIDKDEVKGVGLGIPGAVNEEGVVNKCVNLGWGVVDVEGEMTKLTGWPSKAVNDANAAALGEAMLGAGNGAKNAVMITIGTGVGAGIIVGGKLIAGAHGAGGEAGHICVNENEENSCNCGNKGCLEQYASATGIARIAKEKGMNIETAKDVFDLAKAGDKEALEVVDLISNMLGKSLATISCVADPEVIIIGGGVSKAGPILTDKIAEYFKRYAFHACKETKIVIATLENSAGMAGAAGLVL